MVEVEEVDGEAGWRKRTFWLSPGVPAPRWMMPVFLAGLPLAIGLAFLLARATEEGLPTWLTPMGYALFLAGMALNATALVIWLRSRSELDPAPGLSPELHARAWSQITNDEPKVQPDEVAFLRDAAQRMLTNTWMILGSFGLGLAFFGVVLTWLGSWTRLTLGLFAVFMVFVMGAALFQQRRAAKRFLADYPGT